MSLDYFTTGESCVQFLLFIIQSFGKTFCIDKGARFFVGGDHDLGGIEAHAPVMELDDALVVVADGLIVGDLDVLGDLDHAPLDVARCGGLHGGIRDTLATCHCVEEEFLGI